MEPLAAGGSVPGLAVNGWEELPVVGGLAETLGRDQGAVESWGMDESIGA